MEFILLILALYLTEFFFTFICMCVCIIQFCGNWKYTNLLPRKVGPADPFELSVIIAFLYMQQYVLLYDCFDDII